MSTFQWFRFFRSYGNGYGAALRKALLRRGGWLKGKMQS